MELLWRVTRSRVRSPNRIALEIALSPPVQEEPPGQRGGP